MISASAIQLTTLMEAGRLRDHVPLLAFLLLPRLQDPSSKASLPRPHSLHHHLRDHFILCDGHW